LAADSSSLTLKMPEEGALDVADSKKDAGARQGAIRLALRRVLD
jgi:hypothetical protein